MALPMVREEDVLNELRQLDEARWFEVVDFIGYLRERRVETNGNGTGAAGNEAGAVDQEEKKPYTARDLVDSGLAGLWKDRDDIGDSLEFARKLRRQAETRPHIWEYHTSGSNDAAR